MKWRSLALLGAFFLAPTLASAAPLKLLFFYPGGQGTTEAAQPILDAFTTALQKAGSPELQATYIANKEAGLQFIQKEKPAAALLSLDLFEEHGSTWGATLLARSLQLPSGDGTEQYTLVGKKGVALPGSGKITLHSSHPFSPEFVAKRLFPGMSGVSFEILPSRNVVGDLRKIAAGEKSGFFLLDPYEHRVMNLRAAWVAELADAASSAQIPSPPLVVFPGEMNADQETALKKALLEIGKQSEAKVILQELRLKGFQAP